jgi:hypothetical protein
MRGIRLAAIPARTLVCALLSISIGGPLGDASSRAPEPTSVQRSKTVHIGLGLTDEEIIVSTAALAGQGTAAPLLLDGPGLAPYLKDLLRRFQPDQVVLLGKSAEQQANLESRLGVTIQTPVINPGQFGIGLWQGRHSSPTSAVVCPAQPRHLLLQSACLAGILGAPLCIMHGQPSEIEALHGQLSQWGCKKVCLIANALPEKEILPGVEVCCLPDEREVAARYVELQRQKGPIQTLIVTNPADISRGWEDMSNLGPWLALQKRAALLFTNESGTNTNAVVEQALNDWRLLRTENLILLGSLQAIPLERRPNPIQGKDAFIEMEPLTPTGTAAFTFATGRLFQPSSAHVLLTFARQKLLDERNSPPRALLVSNPGGGLPLLETFSRSTANELRNTGYQTTTMFGMQANQDRLRRLLPEQDIFLWEGHHSTMVKEYRMPDWTEPLQPSLVFLQSCLALCAGEAYPFLERGAIGVIGTSTRTYSASGGAFSLAFFDALLYEQQTLGGSVRQAKNYLLALGQLKEKRLGSEAKLRGANERSSWAFSLWGDPTVTMPKPVMPPDSLPPVQHEVKGNTIIIWRPEAAYDKVASKEYRAQLDPNGRLAGLLHKDAMSATRMLEPLLFAEVRLPHAPPNRTPHLRSRIPDDRWVFCWDARRKCGYLLVEPRSKDQGQLRFNVEWQQ